MATHNWHRCISHLVGQTRSRSLRETLTNANPNPNLNPTPNPHPNPHPNPNHRPEARLRETLKAAGTASYQTATTCAYGFEPNPQHTQKLQAMQG